jgi:two-component system, chemotaxis family, sensor kinase CheA
LDESGTDAEYFAGFLEDYFAECEEHMADVRRALLSLEASVNQPGVDQALLDELLRSFHSLKGISGMVGLREAEKLAHEIEGYLRVMRQGEALLTPAGMDLLIVSIKILEEVLNAHRSQTPLPGITPVLDQLVEAASKTTILSSSVSLERVSAAKPIQTGLSAEEAARLETACQKGHRVWRFEFTPSPALAARGVNVNTIRVRLQEIGELIHAAPLIVSQGGITFEFIIASREDEEIFAAWLEDGLSYSRYEPPPSPFVSTQNGQAGNLVSDPTSPKASAQMIRVDLQRLDELMRMVGELVISRSHLENKLKGIEAAVKPSEWRSLQETNLAIGRQLRDLREGIMQARMVPIGEIFERMQFVIRDLARESGKHVRLKLSGQDTEIDKYLVERMVDPLIHLVRNAVSHGLETTQERLAAGKTAECHISLRAFTAGEMVTIELEDDGRGIDSDFVAARARSAGLLSPGVKLDDEALLNLICEPGFSTRAEADRASGRGIGMSVVQKTILDLGGTLALSTQVGMGTGFRIELPLTLAIADAMIARVQSQIFAIPQSAVREVIEIEPATIKILENNEIIEYRNSVLPLLRLNRFFGLAGSEPKSLYAFVVGSGSNLIGVVVDRIIGQREIVVRALADPLVQVQGVAGATELGDGRAVLILDAFALVRSATGYRRAVNGQKRIHPDKSESEISRWTEMDTRRN